MHILVAANVMPTAFKHQCKAPAITSRSDVDVSSRMHPFALLAQLAKGRRAKKKDSGERRKDLLIAAPPT